MGAHDRVAPDLPGALGVIVMPITRVRPIESPLTCGIELRGAYGAPAAQHDAKPCRVPA